MSSIWITLISLLLLINQIKTNENFTEIIKNSHLIELRTSDFSTNDSKKLSIEKVFKCENENSLLINNARETNNNFKKIKLLSPIAGQKSKCQIRFETEVDHQIELILNYVQLNSLMEINSSQCILNVKFEEINFWPKNDEKNSFSNSFCVSTFQDYEKSSKSYLSKSNNITLNFMSELLLSSFIINIEYRFKSKLQTKNLINNKSICDLVLYKCLAPARCNYESIHSSETSSKNITCKYLISHQNSSSSNDRIIISQHHNNHYLTSLINEPEKCLKGSIFFYENSSSKKLIKKQCLPFPTKPLFQFNQKEILIVIKSDPYELLKSNIQLVIGTDKHKTRSVRLADQNGRNYFSDQATSCQSYYNASTTLHRQGQIIFDSQMKNQFKDSPCYIHLNSNNSFDRIWFYFSEYRHANLLNVASKQFNSQIQSSNCKIAEFKILDSIVSNNINDGKVFCGLNQPKVCNIKEKLQCVLPTDSYLSTGPRLSLMAVNKINPSMYLLPLQFTLNYEFINTQEYGEAVPGTVCDRLFDSSRFKHGTVRSTRNLFLFGRGGRKSLNCAYIFRGQPGQRLRIQLYRIKVKSSDCIQQREHNSGTNKCVNLSNSPSNNPSSKFSVWDSISNTKLNKSADSNTNQIKLPIDCFCNKTVKFLTPISYHLIGGLATLNFTIEQMKPNEDFNDYAFDAFYEFLSTSNDFYQNNMPFIQSKPTQILRMTSVPPKNYSLTSFSLNVPSNFSFDYYQEFKQRQRLIAKPSESVYINVPNGFLWRNEALRTCSQLSRLVVYWLLPPYSINNHAVATICFEPYKESDIESSKLGAFDFDQTQLTFEINSPSSIKKTKNLNFFANNTVSNIDLVVELIATSKGRYRFDWLQSQSQSQNQMNNYEINSNSKSKLLMQTSESNNSKNNLSDDEKIYVDKIQNNSLNVSSCLAFCPEDSFCLKLDFFCDQISHCVNSGWDESPLICDAKEQNRLSSFLKEIQHTTNDLDKISSTDDYYKYNWLILFSLSIIFLILFVIYTVFYLKRRRQRIKNHQSIVTAGDFAQTALHLNTGSASSTYSGNSSITKNSCTNSMLTFDKRLRKLRQKVNKEQLTAVHQIPSNALSLMQNSLEDNNIYNPLIPSFRSTIQSKTYQPNIADYVSTNEFQFEYNQDRLSNYNRQIDNQERNKADFSPIYKKIDSLNDDQYSLKQQHIYYQPTYTTLQHNSHLSSNKNLNQSNKPPLPNPLILPSQKVLSNFNHQNNDQLFESQNFTNLRTHHTIARQSLLDSNQAERLLMNTPPIYEVADRSSIHRSAFLRAAAANANYTRRFS